MAQALRLAEQGLFSAAPNPRVGCVIVHSGKIVGEGWHCRTGQPHAEVLALQAAGRAARGSTAYVTLEPCSHFGRTPPCAEALVAAGVARVVAAMQDPNPQVSGRGLAFLSAVGILVETGLLEAQARELNIGFVSRMTRGRPWVRLKLASSLDGRTALQNGDSQWITGPAARLDGHRWRARACALLTGIGTVLKDNPQLTVRGIETPRQPLKIVVDGRLETPPQARILQDGALLVSAGDAPARAAALRARGGDVLDLPDGSGRVDLAALMTELGRRGINELHVEGGERLNGALLSAGLADEILLYMAPCVMGGHARGMFSLPVLENLEKRHGITFHEVVRVGEDMRIIARVN